MYPEVCHQQNLSTQQVQKITTKIGKRETLLEIKMCQKFSIDKKQMIKESSSVEEVGHPLKNTR